MRGKIIDTNTDADASLKLIIQKKYNFYYIFKSILNLIKLVNIAN